MANSNPSDANKQAAYLKLLLEVDPHEVINRYESKLYAENSEVKQIYMNVSFKERDRVDYYRHYLH